jgi:hypothetical protein
LLFKALTDPASARGIFYVACDSHDQDSIGPIPGTPFTLLNADTLPRPLPKLDPRKMRNANSLRPARSVFPTLRILSDTTTSIFALGFGCGVESSEERSKQSKSSAPRKKRAALSEVTVDWSKSILAFEGSRARLSVRIERWGPEKDPETQK